MNILKYLPEITLTSDSFPSGVVSPSGLRPVPDNPYFGNQQRRARQRYSAKFSELVEQDSMMRTRLTQVLNVFEPLIGDYDMAEILPTTCALGLMPPHHFDMDEKGILGRHRDYRVPIEIEDYLIKHYRPLIGRAEDEHLSLPRGKNAGWPTLFSRRSRDMSDILLAIHAAYAIGARKSNKPLSHAIAQLESIYGPAFSQSGERYQHTAKVMPLIISNGHDIRYSARFEPRVRGIYFSPKFAVAYNRFEVKQCLRAILSSPYHCQDRAQIAARIREMQEKFDTISLDVSKYDQSMGGNCGLDVIRIMSEIVTADEHEQKFIRDNLTAEFQLPFLLPTKGGLKMSNGGEILSSGLSSTTILGCLGSHIIVAQILLDLGVTPDRLDTCRGKLFDALTYGDDIVIGIDRKLLRKSGFETVLHAAESTGQRMQFTFTSEPTLKFLGQNYDMLNFRQSAGYPLGRFIQQQFFPERVKRFPFATYGYIARLSLMDSALQPRVHERMRALWDEATLGPYFKFDERSEVMRRLLPEIERRSAEISQLDDVLGIFFHGLDARDVEDAGLGSGLDGFDSLLAMSSLDVSDPIRVIENTGHASRQLVDAVTRLLTYNRAADFKRAEVAFCQIYNLRSPTGPYPAG